MRCQHVGRMGFFLVQESVTSATEMSKPTRGFGRGRRGSGHRRTCAVGHCDCHARRRARVRCRSGSGRRGARLVSSERLNLIFQRFELRPPRGNYAMIFFDRANSQRHFRFFLLTAKQREVDIGRLFLTKLRLFTFKAHGQSTRRDGVDREHAAPPRGRRRVEGRGQRLLPRGRFPQGRGRVYQGAQGTSSRACSRVPSFESRVSRADDLRRRARRGRFDRAHLPCPRSRFPPALRLPARTPRPSPSWRRFTATAARRS